ncbi:M949_RS01915 family surface polysaccharide biosynthesis protein [Flavobacterium sp. GCM10023249]|uniref:M949_RS01915 family surface polysaccharide biosynthesis protein n=1 Tax=unclassified Flavobacterium TaxID=196869 RepID=UPI0036120ED8
MLSFSVAGFSQTQIKIAPFDITKLPKEITYEGKIKTSVSWTDRLGKNIVITTETGIHQSKKFKHELDGSDAELFAYHFIVSNTTTKPTWRVYDYISDCPVDIEASFVKNTFQVTDLDNNGIAEIWLMYRTVCHGDISPSTMKIIMYQGAQKYAMRGESKVRVSEKEFIGGDYIFDNAFLKGPKAFTGFAKKLWNTHVVQTWDE